MKDIFRKALSIFLTLTIFFGMIPAVMGAEETAKEVNSSAAFCEAMEKGGSIRLTGDFVLEAKAKIPAGVTVTLDLNGKTISSNNGEEHNISNAGTLTILDSGKDGTISVKSAGKSMNVICIDNLETGELTIEGGSFAVTSDNRAAYAVYSKGKSVTINGGTFTASYTKSKGVYNAHTLGLGGTNSTATINGGTFTATSTSEHSGTRVAPLYVMSEGSVKITINDGTFTGTRTVGANGASVLRANGTGSSVDINGGTFCAENAGEDCMFNTMKGRLNIKGGVFSYDGRIFQESTANITGGTFLNVAGTKIRNVSEYLGSRYVQLDDGSVQKATTVPDMVKVGTAACKSFCQAINKSQAGDILILQTDVKLEFAMVLAEGLTLDLNGYKLEATDVSGHNSQIIDSAQKGLLKVDRAKATFDPNNSQLPLWDAAAGGYRMADAKIRIKDSSNGVFYFRFDLANAAWEALLPENEVSLQLRVSGHETPYTVPEQSMTALYKDTTDKGAIKVTFAGWRNNMSVQVDIACNAVQVTKEMDGLGITALGPVGSVDTVAVDVRDYLAKASALYDDLTFDQINSGLDNFTLKTPKGKDQTLYDSMQPVAFGWRWETPEKIPAESQFAIQLSLTEDFADSQMIPCTRFNAAVTSQYEPVWNLRTDTTYYWRVVATLPDGSTVMTNVQTFTTEAGPRLIHVTGAKNVRDVGGWNTGEVVLSDGTVLPAGKTTQGLVYRSARLEHLTSGGVDTLLNELGIRTEIELRPDTAGADEPNENAETHPMLLNSGRWNYFRGDELTALNYEKFILDEDHRTKQYLMEFTKPENYPIIVHCSAGADRTGSLMFMLGALQGVSEADLIKDYELTDDRKIQGFYTESLKGFPLYLKEFHALEGNTTYEKARTFCRKAGLTDSEIDTIILLMRGQ